MNLWCSIDSTFVVFVVSIDSSFRRVVSSALSDPYLNLDRNMVDTTILRTTAELPWLSVFSHQLRDLGVLTGSMIHFAGVISIFYFFYRCFVGVLCWGKYA